MTAPTFVNAGAVDAHSFATTVTPPLPASRTNGNLLIAFVNASTIGQTRTFTFPGGWNTIGTPISHVDGNSALAWRFVDGTETAPAITMSGPSFGGADDLNAVIYQYTGVDGGNPIGNVSHTGPGVSSSATITEAGILLERNNSVVLGLVTGGGSAGSTVVTPPSGYSAESNINTGGLLLLYDDPSVSVAGAGSTAFSVTLAASRRYMAWSIEIASEALTTELDINAGTQSIGADMAASLSVAQSLIAAPALGVDMAAAISKVASVVASADLGVSMSASFDDATHVAAAPSLGIDMAAAVIAELRMTATASLGVSMAASLNLFRNLDSADSLGITMHATIGARRHNQPVVVCTT